VPNFAPSLIAALIWGAMFTVASTALDEIDAVHMTAIRYAVASLVFLVLLRFVEGAKALSFDGRFWRVLYLGTAGFAGFNLLSFAALEHTSPAHAALVVATTPVVTLLYRWASVRERPTGVQLACVVAAFAGVGLVITRGDLSSLGDGALGIGELMVLGAVVCWARYTAGAAELPGWSSLRFSALTAAAGTGVVLAITAVADLLGWLSPPTAGDLADELAVLAYVILFGAIVAVLAWNAGVRRLGPARASLFMNLVPVVAFTIEAVRGTNPAPFELAGAALTLAALVVANVAGRRATSALAHPPQRPDPGPDDVVRPGGGGERAAAARALAAPDQPRA
jgi:drug/metabolite transporter (DMT)-like permease